VVQVKYTQFDVRFKGHYYHSSLFARIHSVTNLQFLHPTLSHFYSNIQFFSPTLSTAVHCIHEQKWESVGGKNCILVYEQQWNPLCSYFVYSSFFLHFPTFVYKYSSPLLHFSTFVLGYSSPFLHSATFLHIYIQFSPPTLSHFSS
jgi:hypothetical protein